MTLKQTKYIFLFTLFLAIPSNAMFRALGMMPERVAALSPFLLAKTKQQQAQQQNNKAAAKFMPVVAGIGATSTALGLNTAKQEACYKAPWQDARDNYYKLLLSKPWGAVSKKYIEFFKQRENELLQDFFKLAGITEQEFEASKMERNEEYLELLMRSSAHILNDNYALRIKQAFDLIGIDKSKVKIIIDENIQTMAANEYHLSICPDGMSEYINVFEFDASVFHEIMHMLHSDAFISWVMARWSAKAGYSSFIPKWNHFTERRADILAGLLHPEYAFGSYRQFERSLPLTLKIFPRLRIGSPEAIYDSHPKDSVRVAYLRALHKEMLAAQAQKTA